MTKLDRIAQVIGTGFFTGYFPIFPGTIGSIVGVGINYLAVKTSLFSASSPVRWIVTLAVILLVGIPASFRCEKIYGQDNSKIVIDEIWGMMVALYLLPLKLPYIVLAFLLFRIFDIVKPYPARQTEKIGWGVGVMLDDGISGAYVAVLLNLFVLLRG